MRRAGVGVGLLILGLTLTAGVRPAAAAPTAPAAGGASVSGGPPCVGIECLPSGGLAGGAADVVGKAVFGAFVAWVADGAAAVLGHVSGQMTDSTKVDLGATWFTKHVGAMQGVAIVILLPLVLAGIIGAVIHRDFSQLMRVVGVYVPVAVIGGALAVAFTNLALSVSDQLTGMAAGNMRASTDKAVESLLGAMGPMIATLPGQLLTVVILLLLFVGAFFIWIELLIRASAIYIVVLFLPIALSGLVWPATARWTRRMIEALAALILSKFVIVTVISLATDSIADASGRGGNDKLALLTLGASFLLLASFAPFALLKLIPIAEAGVIGHLEGLERRPVAAAARGTAAATNLVLAAAAALGEGGGGKGGAGGGPAPPTPGGELNHVRAPEEGAGSGSTSAAPAVEENGRAAGSAVASMGPGRATADDGG